ncbi:MAG: RagB/SusD family nutrient uptake outer membrane protein, partial [Rikenellaceae bacterium]
TQLRLDNSHRHSIPILFLLVLSLNYLVCVLVVSTFYRIRQTGLPELYDRDEIFDCTNDKNMLTYARAQVDAASPPMFTKLDGTKMEYAGLSGCYNGYNQGSTTGFLLRKNLDVNLEASNVNQNRGDAPWIDKRYAEVLLCRAEAAYELAKLGDPAGSVSDAVAAIDDIRKRAGCTIFYDESTLTREVIRDEFFRELAFENKGYWNLIRWRTYHEKHTAARRYHAALPVYAGAADKWFYIVKYSELGKSFTFNAANYYIVLPDNQISSNPNIVQNPK